MINQTWSIYLTGRHSNDSKNQPAPRVWGGKWRDLSPTAWWLFLSNVFCNKCFPIMVCGYRNSCDYGRHQYIKHMVDWWWWLVVTTYIRTLKCASTQCLTTENRNIWLVCKLSNSQMCVYEEMEWDISFFLSKLLQSIISPCMPALPQKAYPDIAMNPTVKFSIFFTFITRKKKNIYIYIYIHTHTHTHTHILNESGFLSFWPALITNRPIDYWLLIHF